MARISGNNDKTITRTTCPRDCYDACGIAVVRRSDGAVRVLGDPDHPVSRGALCGKCAIAYNGAFLDKSARLLSPLKRIGAKGDGRFAEIGCDEIDIADTIGVGTAKHTREVFEAVTKVFPRERLSGHFHDTYGQALANIYAALFEGIEIFHASVAGLGGCPYAKGATGNVATEDVLYLMQGLGIDTGIDLAQVVAAGDFISNAIGRANVSRAGRALLAKARSAADAASCV